MRFQNKPWQFLFHHPSKFEVILTFFETFISKFFVLQMEIHNLIRTIIIFLFARRLVAWNIQNKLILLFFVYTLPTTQSTFFSLSPLQQQTSSLFFQSYLHLIVFLRKKFNRKFIYNHLLLSFLIHLVYTLFYFLFSFLNFVLLLLNSILFILMLLLYYSHLF